MAAGISRSDPRVKESLRWLGDHYTLDANPGATPPRQQLYEYYLALASTMMALGVERLVDGQGVEHDWRSDLFETLVAQQEADGSWVNYEESPDPEESTRLVTTSYAVMTLEKLMPPRGKGKQQSTPAERKTPACQPAAQAFASVLVQ
jgi:squalene-hopene/tetraprenyl-beta-curcumene cyclase